MIPFIVIGGYLGIGLIVFWGSAFFPPKNGTRHSKEDLLVWGFGWPFILIMIVAIGPFAGIGALHDWISDRMIARRERKMLQAQQVKQLAAPIDVVIEETPTNYRTADCQGCGRPLQ